MNDPMGYVDEAAVTVRVNEVEGGENAFRLGMNIGGANSSGIGIATDNPNLEQQLPNWTLLDQDENARTPQLGGQIGGVGLNGGTPASPNSPIQGLENLGNGSVSLIGEATLAVLADGWELDAPANLGPELITNGSFATDLSGWDNGGGGVSWNAGGYAQRLVISTGNFDQDAIAGLVQGALYRVTITYADTTGGLFVGLGRDAGTSTEIPPTVGQQTVVGNIVCGFDNFDLGFRSVDGTFSKLDNISVKAVL